MAKPDDERRESGWLRRKEMARVFDVSLSDFDKCIRPLAWKHCVRGDDKKAPRAKRGPLEFYCRGVVQAWADRHGAPASSGGSESDPLLAGGSSPALEDYRRQKAELAKLDLAERRRELVNLEEFRELHMRLARNLRKAGEQLQRQCGNEAWQILDEALVACEMEMNAHLEGTDAL